MTMYEEGIRIGSHTVTHIDVRYSSNSKIAKEYKESKEFLEEAIDSEISGFCYPIGGVTPYAKQTLKDLGYKTAVRATYGKAHKTQGLYDLRRVRIDYNSIKGFLNKIKRKTPLAIISIISRGEFADSIHLLYIFFNGAPSLI